ncbi:MAG: PP2C family protein-serine/threonine phosphatase [Gemmataceae bacterium]
MAKAQIYLCGANSTAADDIRAALAEANCELVTALEGAQLVIMVAGSVDEVVASWHTLRDAMAALAQPGRELSGRDMVIPVLVVSSSSEVRTGLLERGADAALAHPFHPSEFLAQALALLRTKARQDQLFDSADEIARVQRRLQQSFQQLDAELELARRVQQSFLPAAMPQVPGVQFAVHCRPCGRVGGDCHDVFRVDEKHVAFYLADTPGHGVAASLQALYLKRGVRAKEITGNQYRLTPPDEVLQRLNRELIALSLADQPFVTMTYGLIDASQKTLHYARAGQPRPIYLPAEGEPQVWPSTGPLLGVFNASFTTHVHELRAGDKVLFHTDGVEALGADKLLETAARLRERPLAEFVACLAAEWPREVTSLDDVTLLALSIS